MEPPDTDAIDTTSALAPASTRASSAPQPHTVARCPPPEMATPMVPNDPPPRRRVLGSAERSPGVLAADPVDDEPMGLLEVPHGGVGPGAEHPVDTEPRAMGVQPVLQMADVGTLGPLA